MKQLSTNNGQQTTFNGLSTVRRPVLLLTLCLLICFSSCSKARTSVAPINNQITNIKAGGRALATALTEGIKLEADLAAAGEIDPQLHSQLQVWLSDAKAALEAFNERAQNYKSFDAGAKADIAKIAADSISFLRQMEQEGVLHIKNPNSRGTARAILAGAQVAAEYFKSITDQSQE